MFEFFGGEIMNDSKKVYAAPALVEYGSIEEMTKDGLLPIPDLGVGGSTGGG